MTGTSTRNPTLERLRSLSDARTCYEERFGWPVTIEVRPGRLVMRLGEVADAVVMPHRLGREVLADLRIAMLAGPVLADSDGQWWMFLTRPACHGAPKHEDVLRRIEVHPVPSGARVVVPCEFDAKNGCPWIERPRSLPHPATVVRGRRHGPSHRVDSGAAHAGARRIAPIGRHAYAIRASVARIDLIKRQKCV
ncbi:hypothetical protein LWC34_12005 [Kibdelosporangium philippinense]|uniref:DNA primase/polymerase bifunctional N-terminal domain-containing protein n=1 Tax=Kibdelosporangium philippinense TaxID=211113 RepID=A0ABS8Z6P0_9PSEU|nr:hypothetical protein [Kibdelosporangium philippinense]MCE7003546.1 hypothetical protein [Kibdelosporangium philippinense]